MIRETSQLCVAKFCGSALLSSSPRPPPIGFLLEGGTKDRRVQREKNAY